MNIPRALFPGHLYHVGLEQIRLVLATELDRVLCDNLRCSAIAIQEVADQRNLTRELHAGDCTRSSWPDDGQERHRGTALVATLD